MSKAWERIDHEVAETPMPAHLQDQMVNIYCNDCGEEAEVKMHIVGQKCPVTTCGSYNTRAAACR